MTDLRKTIKFTCESCGTFQDTGYRLTYDYCFSASGDKVKIGIPFHCKLCGIENTVTKILEPTQLYIETGQRLIINSMSIRKVKRKKKAGKDFS